MSRDVLRRINELRRKKHNLTTREIENIAMAAGWVYERTTGSHIIYSKAGVREPLTIPSHGRRVKGMTALRLLNQIRESAQEEEAHDEQA